MEVGIDENAQGVLHIMFPGQKNPQKIQFEKNLKISSNNGADIKINGFAGQLELTIFENWVVADFAAPEEFEINTIMALQAPVPPQVHTGLEQIGIYSWKTIYRNPTWEELRIHELDPSLPENERGVMTSLGAVAVDTGKFTGRSPKDKYIIKDSITANNIWWSDDQDSPGSDNKPLSPKTWEKLKEIAVNQLNGKKLYVVDGFCGADPDTRLKVRIVTEVAWQAHFFKNMFIRPSKQELENFEPDWTILNACKTTCENYQQLGLRSENFVAFNFSQRMTVIGGTWYGGEIKKGMFSVMNYLQPLNGIGSFHCSANMGNNNDTALFFGLSGTGKTTLSTDPKRALIGDDEHLVTKDGKTVNIEGGCYAKTIDLEQDKEPEIYGAIRPGALLENVVVDQNGDVDFTSAEKTQNTRVSYPIEHIQNRVKPASVGTFPSRIVFLSCDAYGVLPPVAKLTPEQAMYYFISGYTAKVAGTELGVKEPQATFSACFGQAFLLHHPTVYAELLRKIIEQYGTQVYLVNTGWVNGGYGTGNRIPLKQTRAIIDSIMSGQIDNAEFETLDIFNLSIPKSLPGVDTQLLNPQWEDKQAYDKTSSMLADKFNENFAQFAATPTGKKVAQAGPTTTTLSAQDMVKINSIASAAKFAFPDIQQTMEYMPADAFKKISETFSDVTKLDNPHKKALIKAVKSTPEITEENSLEFYAHYLNNLPALESQEIIPQAIAGAQTFMTQWNNIPEQLRATATVPMKRKLYELIGNRSFSNPAFANIFMALRLDKQNQLTARIDQKRMDEVYLQLIFDTPAFNNCTRQLDYKQLDMLKALTTRTMTEISVKTTRVATKLPEMFFFILANDINNTFKNSSDFGITMAAVLSHPDFISKWMTFNDAQKAVFIFSVSKYLEKINSTPEIFGNSLYDNFDSINMFWRIQLILQSQTMQSLKVNLENSQQLGKMLDAQSIKWFMDSDSEKLQQMLLDVRNKGIFVALSVARYIQQSA